MTAFGCTPDLGRSGPAPMRAARRTRGTQESGNCEYHCEYHCARDLMRIRVGRASSIRQRLRIAALGLASVAMSALVVFPASLPAGRNHR